MASGAVLKPVPPRTRWILTVAVLAAVAALMATALVFDEETEFGTPEETAFAGLLGFSLGPVLIVAGLFALRYAFRPTNLKLLSVAVTGIAFGAFMTWVFFVETTELPDFWPY